MHFLEVVHALMSRVAGTDLPEDAQRLLLEKLRKVVPVLQPGVQVQGEAINHWAALRIQRSLRQWLARRRAVMRQRSLRKQLVPEEYWSCSDDEGSHGGGRRRT